MTMPRDRLAPASSRSVRLWTGAVLRYVRHRQGWTQAALARQMGLSDTTWSRFEQGSLPLPGEILGALELLLQIPPGSLHASGIRLSSHFLGTTGTAAWRFRKADEAFSLLARPSPSVSP